MSPIVVISHTIEAVAHVHDQPQNTIQRGQKCVTVCQQRGYASCAADPLLLPI